MIGKTNGGGGRDRFRPTVYGGTTTPANPKNGDFYIYTGTAISGTELNGFRGAFPTWTMPEGFVYIGSGGVYNESSYVNLINIRNGVHNFCPCCCYQDEGGTWYQKDAYVYRNGAWLQFSTWAAPWDGTLWGPNNQYTDHTGGWGYASSNSNAPYFGDFIRWSCDNTTMFLYTNWAVDVAKYSKLRYDGQMWGEISFGLANKNGWGLVGSNWGARITGNGTVYNGSVDISGVSGSFYVVAYATSEGGSGALFNKIWLE